MAIYKTNTKDNQLVDEHWCGSIFGSLKEIVDATRIPTITQKQ